MILRKFQFRDSTKMLPLRDCVWLEEVDIQERSKGGILIAGRDKEEAGRIGRVLAFGSGCYDMSGLQFIDPSKLVNVGKYYLVSKTGDYSYPLHGKKYLLMKVANILAELTEEEVNGITGTGRPTV